MIVIPNIVIIIKVTPKMQLYGVWKSLSDDVLNAINKFIERGDFYTDVRKIKRLLGIDSYDRSKTNFIWRFLLHLEGNGHITRYKEKPRRTFKLPSNTFFLFEDQKDKFHIKSLLEE